MKINQLNSSHIPQMLNILKSHEMGSNDFDRFGLNWSEGQIQTAIAHDLCFGWFESDQLVSFILGRKVDEETFEIDMTMTDPKNLQRGNMGILFNEVLGELKKHFPLKQVWLEVHEENVPAIALYKKLGFLEDSRRPRYYSDGKAAILMTFNL